MIRKDVKEFFERQKDGGSSVLWGVVIAVVGIFVVSQSFSLGLILLMIGGVIVFVSKRKRDISDKYAALRHFKQKDMARLLERAFDRTQVDLGDLITFDAEDMLDFAGGEERGDRQAELQSKSVVLYGPAETIRDLKIVEIGGERVVEINPWRVTVLFLTATQLMGYEAVLDLTRGDLESEEFHRMFLRDVVQIGTTTQTRRFKPDPKSEVGKDLRRRTGKVPEELVRRDHMVRISKTDGGHLQVPIGIPDWRDGSIGLLDQDNANEEDRYIRIAQEMSRRIDEVKAGLAA